MNRNRRIRGNTGELFQQIAVSASQLAGPIFDDATGTLPQRLQYCIDNPHGSGYIISTLALQRLQGLLDVIRAERE